jgi:hypothetical protein
VTGPGRTQTSIVTALVWIGLGIVVAMVLLVTLGVFVEERALQVPRLYEDDSAR